MKILIVYYSRTGTTAKIAKELAQNLHADIEELHDQQNRQGWWRWFIAGRDGMSKRTTTIEKPLHDSVAYDLIILGTPIWVNATPAVRTYARDNADKFKQVAFFCTMGGSGGKPVFEELTQITGKQPIATMELRHDDVVKGNYTNALREFISKIK